MILLMLSTLTCMLLSPINALASYFELSLSGSYSRTRYSDQDYSVNEAANAGLAYRFFGYSAIEFGYSVGKTTSVRNSDVTIDSSTIIDKQIETIDSEVYSVSWKQYLAGNRSSIIPFFKLGYAALKTGGDLEWTLKDGRVVVFNVPVETEASGLAGLGLQIAVSSRLHLSLAAVSVFPKFDISRYEDKLTYSAGLTLFF